MPLEALGLFKDHILDASYPGPLPQKVKGDAAHDQFAEWAANEKIDSETSGEVAVRFRFSGTRVNLGDFASGGIKALLDGLSGVLGSSTWQDVDHRVIALVAEKGFDLDGSAVAVTVSRAAPGAFKPST